MRSPPSLLAGRPSVWRVLVVLLAPLVAAPAPPPTQTAPVVSAFAPWGTATLGFTVETVTLGLPARLVEAGDLDGDSDLDLVVLAEDEQTTRTIVLRAHGGSGFAIWWEDETRYPTSLWGLDLELGDLDQDGDLDLTVNAPGLGLAARFNAGDATFDEIGDIPDQGLYVDLEVADLDGDEALDIAYYELDILGYMGAHAGHGDGTFSLAFDLPLSQLNQSDLRIALGDVTGDGLYELLVAANSGLYQVLGKLVPGFFPYWQTTATLLAGGVHRDVVTGDLDGDGLLDVVGAATAANAVSVLLGQPSGGLSSPVLYAAGLNPSAAAFGDIDADGRLDVVVANRRGEVSVLPGTGAGGLATPVEFKVGRRLSDVATCDLDSDGDIDIAVTDLLGTLLILRNQIVP
jgi:hypothetical protein